MAFGLGKNLYLCGILPLRLKSFFSRWYSLNLKGKMITPIIPEDDVKRVEALKAYSILDTLPEEEFDDITYLASQICQTPVSLISLIDDKRQWFKSHHGIEATETPREIAFCAHAILEKDQLFIVNDSRQDLRFHDNPLVTGDPHVIFYAGMPLVSADGYSLGTLCVIDHKPRNLEEPQIKALKALSAQVGRLFELRKKSYQLEATVSELANQNVMLEKFAGIAAHDIKSPLSNIVMMSELFEEQYADQLDEVGRDLLKMIGSSSLKLTKLIDGILFYSRHSRMLQSSREEFSLQQLIKEILPLVDSANVVQFRIFPDDDIFIYSNKIAVEQIFLNLITNGIKYNKEKHPIISIRIEDGKLETKINVADNGPGVPEPFREKIFEIFETAGDSDKFGEKGNGIGLATVQTLVKGLGGEIHLVSGETVGANFEFTLKK